MIGPDGEPHGFAFEPRRQAIDDDWCADYLLAEQDPDDEMSPIVVAALCVFPRSWIGIGLGELLPLRPIRLPDGRLAEVPLRPPRERKPRK